MSQSKLLIMNCDILLTAATFPWFVHPISNRLLTELLPFSTTLPARAWYSLRTLGQEESLLYNQNLALVHEKERINKLHALLQSSLEVELPIQHKTFEPTCPWTWKDFRSTVYCFISACRGEEFHKERPTLCIGCVDDIANEQHVYSNELNHKQVLSCSYSVWMTICLASSLQI